MAALRAEAVIDTATAVTAVISFRVLNFEFIRLQGRFGPPISPCAHLVQVVRASKLHLPPGDLASFIITIRDTDVCKFEARIAPYGLDHRWLQ